MNVHKRACTAVVVFFLSIPCYSGRLKITILSSIAKQEEVTSSLRSATFGYFPVSVHNEQMNFISHDKIDFSATTAVAFEFDDSMDLIMLYPDIEKRLLKWLSAGWQSCIIYCPNHNRILGVTGKSYWESGLLDSPEPQSFSFTDFLVLGIKDFTGIGFKINSQKVELESLKSSDLTVLRSKVTGFVIHSMIYIGNEVFMSLFRGEIYFQNLDQLKSLWGENSTLEIVRTVTPSELLKQFGPGVEGYMRPVDAAEPPIGSYIN